MFGTVGRGRIQEENREKLLDVMRKYEGVRIPGHRRTEVMFPENRPDEVLIAVWFEDANSYWKNAEDPAQHERYLEYRALLEGDPEWSDGEWHPFEVG
ncbi:MAG TPA: antibiotic biosynthesis monooxygenase [Actinomycetota bacterium]|nr:antibiotic biosynthesis monooxygenase [Actinomycetota bacterium]